MVYKRAIGRPPKVNYRTVVQLADLIQHNTTITEACRYVGISRDTYYRHFNNEVFAEKMVIAKDNQNKVVFSFLTTPQIN
jgi:ACT domain-containing protein